MLRTSWVYELVQQKYPFYTAEVRQCIAKFTAENEYVNVDDIVIEQLWRLNDRKLFSIAFPDEKPIPRGGRHQAHLPTLTEQGRKQLTLHINEARNYEENLKNLNDHKLQNLHNDIMTPVLTERKTEQARRASADDVWDFFNRPDAEPDHESWKLRLLTADQLTALSLGYDPDVVNINSIGPTKGPLSSPFRETYRNRLRFIQLAIANGDIQELATYKSFIVWANAKGLHVADGMINAGLDKNKYDVDKLRNELELLKLENISLQKQIDSLQSASTELRKKEKMQFVSTHPWDGSCQISLSTIRWDINYLKYLQMLRRTKLAFAR